MCGREKHGVLEESGICGDKICDSGCKTGFLNPHEATRMLAVLQWESNSDRHTESVREIQTSADSVKCLIIVINMWNGFN